MEPTEKQLSDLLLLIEECAEETTVGERMRRAWDYVARETADAEREACAKLCDEDIQRYSNTVFTNNGYWYGKRDWNECSEAIRKRSNPK